MSMDLIQVPEIPDSSQMELVDLPVDTPNLRRNHGKRPNYTECGNTDSETQDATDEAGAESEDAVEDIPARIQASRVTTRSRAKKEAENLEVTPASIRRSNATKRSHDDHETKTTKRTKCGRPSAATTRIKQFEKDTRGWVEVFTSTTRDLETAGLEIQELKRDIKLVKSSLEQERAKHMEVESELKQDIRRLESECKRWRVKLESALDEAKKDSGKYVKVPDSDLQERWKVLCFNIRNLVSQHLTEKPFDQVVILSSLVMGHLLLSPYDLLNLRTSILRRAIWSILILAVFDGKFPVWHGNIGATLTQFLSANNDDHKDDPQYLEIISQIKRRVVADLNEELYLNKKAMNDIIDEVTEQFRPFLPDSRLERESFKIEIETMITKAAELHSMMMKSKAIFLVEWNGDDDGEQLAPYDPKYMTSVQYVRDADTSNSFVKFVEAPGLVKIGNADGENFDTSMVLCEASVILQEDDADIDEKDEGDEK
ncbi:hypothetical protein TrVFT333_005143 [Trichoderma virens FT-333]|nr:hypothetical protein TrVFT333_005143 [Trichoderma virens FT-333]